MRQGFGKLYVGIATASFMILVGWSAAADSSDLRFRGPRPGEHGGPPPAPSAPSYPGGAGRPVPPPPSGYSGYPGSGPSRPVPPPPPVYHPRPLPPPPPPAPAPAPGYGYGNGYGDGRGYYPPQPRAPYGPPYPPARGGSIVIGDRGRPIYRPYDPVVIRPPLRHVYRDGSFDYDRYFYDLVRGGGAFEIGSTYLAQTTDYDVIPVSECNISQMQLYVRNNDVNIDRLIVVYDDGYEQTLDVNEYYQEGSMSPWKYLGNYGRCIREIVVIGDTVSSYRPYDQGLVEIFGRRY